MVGVGGACPNEGNLVEGAKTTKKNYEKPRDKNKRARCRKEGSGARRRREAGEWRARRRGYLAVVGVMPVGGEREEGRVVLTLRQTRTGKAGDSQVAHRRCDDIHSTGTTLPYR